MILWLILAAMTAAAVFAVVWPIMRRGGDMSSGSDVEVYRDQLTEVERDRAAGLIGQTEAEAARVEISRRLLAAADAARSAAPATPLSGPASRRRRVAAIASLAAVPLIAGGLYLRLGSPQLAAAQSAAESNTAAPDKSIESLVAQAEDHLRRNPDDGHAWEVLAPVYMQVDRYSDSVAAWRNALRLLGENAERDADLGESLTAEANGVVTADAKAAFTRASALDDTLVAPRYYLGLAAEQDGRRDDAAKMWRDLIARAPAGAEWVGEVREALARVEGTASTPPGPDAAQMAAAAKAPPEQQSTMIQAMVERLATRLKQDGSDAAGWAQLVRSYNVLGQPDKVRATIADAQQALANDPAKLAQFNATIKSPGTTDTAASAAPALPVPDAAQMAAAASQPPEQQNATIQKMVDGLAARLKRDGSDAAGWAQLVRSYNVLGQPDKARATVADAQQALANDSAKLAQFNATIKSPGTTEAAAPAPPAMPGPDAAQIAAAAKEPPEQQNAMIQGMVDGLAARLKQDGTDVAGWLRLIRSYNVLNQPDKARAAAADAQTALAGDPAKLAELNTGLKDNSDAAPAPAADAPNFTPRPPSAAPPAHDDAAGMQGMVDGLAERLKKSGSDPEGWLMLVRSYATLGEKEKATAAITDARQALANDPKLLDEFNQALASFKIGD
jgi:cytochrome c-type biogenesis protein CcmH